MGIVGVGIEFAVGVDSDVGIFDLLKFPIFFYTLDMVYVVLLLP